MTSFDSRSPAGHNNHVRTVRPPVRCSSSLPLRVGAYNSYAEPMVLWGGTETTAPMPPLHSWLLLQAVHCVSTCNTSLKIWLPCRVVRPFWGRRLLALGLTRAHSVIRQSEGQTKRQVLRLAPGRRVARLVWGQRLLASNEVTFACISLRGKAPGSSPDPWPACPVARTSRETRCRRGLRPRARPATPCSLTV